MTSLEKLKDAFDAARSQAAAEDARRVTLPMGTWLYLVDAIRDVLRANGGGR